MMKVRQMLYTGYVQNVTVYSGFMLKVVTQCGTVIVK